MWALKQIQIMDFLVTTGKMTSDDVVDVLGVAKRTAQLKLKNLSDKGTGVRLDLHIYA